MADRPTLIRHLRLLGQLSSSRQGCCVRDLAIEYEVSEKTIRRDLESLESAGFRLSSTVGNKRLKYWRLEDSSGVVAPRLDISEMAALYLSRRYLEPLAGTALWESAQSALVKLRQQFSPDALRYLESLAQAVNETTFGQSDYSERAEVIDSLMLGVNESRFTKLLYHPLRSKAPGDYELQPLGLVWHRHTLYLIASSADRPEPRHFKVDRIRDVDVLAGTFTRPSDFDLNRHLEHSLGIYQTDAPVQDVRLWFSADVARYVTEHRWHPSQQIEEQPDGSLLVDLKLSDLTELKSWVLSFGADVRILAPPSLVDALREEITNLLSRYADSSLVMNLSTSD
jgi:predicted DNA-binding transcriptional regulator YafY